MGLRRSAAMTVVAIATAGALSLGVAAPANAITIPDAYDLWNYVQTVKGSQLQAASKVGQQAWTTQTARVAATNANLYTTASVYGNFDPGDLAEVIPIDKPIDAAPGSRKKLTIGAGGRGVTLPAYQGSALQRGLGSVAGAGVAITAFLFRAELANGVLSFVGQNDTTGLVCGQNIGPVLETLSGQDCEGWRAMSAEYGAELEAYVAELGFSGDKVCGTGQAGMHPVTNCIQFVAVYPRKDAGGNVIPNGGLLYQFTVDGTVSGILFERVSSNGTRTWVSTSWQGSSWGCLSANCVNLATQYSMGAYRIENNGAVAEIVEADKDPEFHFLCRVHTGSGPVLSATSPTWRLGVDTVPEPVCPPTPNGATPSLIEIFEVSSLGSELVWSESPTDEHLQYEDEFGELCKVQTCLLDLVQVSSGLSCFGLGEACDGWMTSPTRDTDYKCQYGGVDQPVQECYVYANVFNTQKRLAGKAWPDLATGKDLVGGVGTSLRYDESLMGAPAQNPDAVRQCGGAGWGEPNPLQWVLKPIQCALEWAFVPRPQYVATQMTALKEHFDDTAPGQVSAMVGGWAFAPVMSGCRVEWSFPTPFGEAHTLPVIDACPGSHLAPVANVIRPLITAGMAVLVIVVLRRLSAASVGMGGSH